MKHLMALCALLPLVLEAATLTVSDPEAARKAVRDAMPGDVIVLSAGEWRDADLRLDGEGTAAAPITIRAEVPGKTVFTGASRVRLAGRHFVVSGFHWHNLSGTKADWLEFRIDSKRRANDCRVTDCVFSEGPDFEPAEKENRWIGIYGESNQLDHCRIEGKKNQGASVVVWLGDQDLGRHHLHHNHFGARPSLGKNGGETLRIGDSATSMREAACLVEENLFQHCNGETECVSNKSCGNVYRANTFLEVQGTLTLRHGNRCIVEGNLFLGNLQKHTGGIRVIGEDHQIVGNHLQDLEGDGFRSAIVLVRGISDSPMNGYLQVKNTLIRGNTLLNCKHGLLIGYNDVKEATLPPLGTRLDSNRVQPRPGQSDLPDVPGMEKSAVESRQPPSLDTFGPAWMR